MEWVRLIGGCVIIFAALGCGTDKHDSSAAATKGKADPWPTLAELQNAKPVDPNTFVKIRGGPADNGNQYVDRSTSGSSGSARVDGASQQLRSLLEQAQQLYNQGMQSVSSGSAGPLPGQTPSDVALVLQYLDDISSQVTSIGQSDPAVASDAQATYTRIQTMKMRLSTASFKANGGGMGIMGGG